MFGSKALAKETTKGAVLLLYKCCSTRNMRWPSAGLVQPAQGHTKGALEVGMGHNRMAPWTEMGSMGYGQWDIP